MPCDSRVTQTSMTNADRLAEALADAGFQNVQKSEKYVTADGISFQRYTREGAFQTNSTRDISGIGRAYAVRGVREFAKRAGYSVTNLFEDATTGGLRMRLTNRRGG